MKIIKIANNLNNVNINRNSKINPVTNPLPRDLSAILPEEIGYLNRIADFKKFVNEAYKLIKTISPFKDDICPKISVIPMPPYYKAMYFPKNNTISVNGDVGTITKVNMFEVLSHEFRHSEQVYNALRLDKNKEKNLKTLVDFISRTDEVAYHDIVTKMLTSLLEKQDLSVDSRVFLEHYLETVKREVLMDRKETEELCIIPYITQ